MAQVAINADEYAKARLNKFFPGIVPSLDGQCVSLTKGFMQDMSSVPNPQAARGDARHVGNTLVAQGHATEVPYSQRKRGDLICYEYGTYGHIAVQLSGGRVFEQNVNMSGVASKIVDGSRVYASRIGSESEAWRTGKNPHVYRLKTYKEGSSMAKLSLEFARILAHGILGRNGVTNKVNALSGAADGDLKKHHVGKELTGSYIRGLYRSTEAKKFRSDLAALKKKADSNTTPPPAKVDKAVVVDYINKNLK